MTSVSWDRNWRGSGIFFVLLFIVSWVIYGSQPKVGASADKLVSFYDGDRTRILIAAAILGINILNLMWFAAALSTDLRDAGKGGWATAATASSAALGALFFVLVTLNAALAYSIAGSGNNQITSGLNDLSWVLIVVASFPAAMLIMAGTFGLQRAGIISKASFGAGGGGRGARPGRWDDLGQEWILGAGWCLCAVRHADHRSRVDRSGQRIPLHAESVPGEHARPGSCPRAVVRSGARCFGAALFSHMDREGRRTQRVRPGR
jgi:hypothetical protein